MTLYRRGSVTVEAIKASDVIKLANENLSSLPEWVKTASDARRLNILDTFVDVLTLEGWVKANAGGREGGDWIVQRQTEHGELYPIQDKRFTDPKAGYTRVE